MNEAEQIAAFVGDLQSVIARYRAEFQLTLASAVGALEIIKQDLISQELNRDRDDE